MMDPTDKAVEDANQYVKLVTNIHKIKIVFNSKLFHFFYYTPIFKTHGIQLNWPLTAYHALIKLEITLDK